MSNEMPCPEHVERRAKTELRGLPNSLMSSNDDALQRVPNLILLVGWLLWSFAIAWGAFTEGGDFFAGFTIYQIVSLAVLYIIFRLNDMDVPQILGQMLGIDTGSDGADRRDRNGFRYGDDRRDDDQ